MYQVRPEPISAFIEDHSVRFPRFQRKQTWKTEQNFRLAISIFKTYPIGVTIINKQSYNGKTTRWLLDGRQRRNALLLISQNPENLYDWSKKFLNLKNTDQLHEIRTKFWKRIEDYLNDSDEEGFEAALSKANEKGAEKFVFDGKEYNTESSNSATEEDLSTEFLEIESEEESESSPINDYKQSIWGNLEELLFVITTVHVKQAKKSGFTAPFNFSNIISTLPYSINSNRELCGQKTTTFIKEYLNFLFENNLEDPSEKTLYDFYLNRFPLDVIKQGHLKTEIKRHWNDLFNSINVVKIIKNRLKEAIIGIIETENITATDSQMIFMLINKEGTKLSAVEILSAKPTWNITVNNPSNEIVDSRASLYGALATQVENTVRWDYPATLYERINTLSFLLPKLDYSKNNELEKKLTLGFKILSGIYQKGIKKEDIDSLAINKSIKWETDIDLLIQDLNTMGKILGDAPYFKYLSTWKQTFLDITSDAIALNFLFLTFEDFIRKEKPIGTSSKTRIFINNAIILADKLMHEYVTFKWRGSSDSTISRNLKNFSSLPEKYTPLEDEKWLSLIKKINDDQLIEDTPITFSICKSLVYHIYASHSLMGPDNSSIDIDHIIPQALFASNSTLPNGEIITNSLFNLCPLPSRDNIKKKDKKLRLIEDDWLIQQIEKYSDINKSEFGQYSEVENYANLRTKRRAFFEEKFIEKKNLLIS
jgi:hypothetical protein